MKKTATAVAAVLVSLGVTACARQPVPTATSYAASNQQKMQATHHWDVLAENMATGISSKLSAIPGNRPVYIAPTNQNTDFGRALHNLLTSHLVQKGVAVTTAENGDAACVAPCKPLLLKHESQVVGFSARDGLRPLPGDFTLIKGVAYLIYRVGDLWAAPAWGILPLSEYHEKYFPAGTNNEAIVSVTVNDGDRVVFSESRTYYINGAEQSQYSGPALAPVPHTQNYKVVDQ